MKLPALLLLGLLACAAPRSSSAPPAAPAPAAIATAATAPAAPAPAPALGWLELGGARLLVTTTRAAAALPSPTAALPLLVVLPWARSQPAEVLAELGYVELAVAARIVVVQPFEADGAGFSWWRRARPAPSPADPDRDAELVERLAARAERLAALLPLLQRHFASAGPPVITGVSQGGDLSIMLAVHHPGAIAAALPIAARFPAPLWPSAPPTAAAPPLDAFHGAADPVAPPAALARAVAALAALRFPAAVHIIPGVQHEVAPPLRAALHACAALRLAGSRAPCQR